MRPVALVYLTALIMAVGAERFFWFWSPGLRAQLEVAAYYAIATAGGLALMRRFHVTSWWSLVLVAPVVAFIVEGAITPVIYSGGPFVPVFPAWFTFWHGLLAFGGLVFGLRWLLLRHATRALVATATGLGVFWGVWSSTSWLPENVEDPELVADIGAPLRVLDPAAFGRYAVTMTAVLIVGHFLLGHVWPASGRSSGRIGRLDRKEWAVVVPVAVAVVAWTFVVPWALPMFVVHAGLQIAGLRWHRAGVDPAAPSLIDRLDGTVSLRALSPLALMAPAAAASYAVLWELDPSDGALRVMMYGTIAVQGLVGFVAAVIALVRARRRMPKRGLVTGAGDATRSAVRAGSESTATAR